jgi:hypothetical protein
MDNNSEIPVVTGDTEEPYIPSLRDLLWDFDNGLLPADTKAFQHYKDDKDRGLKKKTWVHIDELRSLSTLNKVNNIFEGGRRQVKRRGTD